MSISFRTGGAAVILAIASIGSALLGFAGAGWVRAGAGAERLPSIEEYCGPEPDPLCRLEHSNHRSAWRIGALLAARNCLIATAESVTVGNFARAFGETKWAGRILAGGVVAYETSVKNALLDVPDTTDRGVISETGAEDMVAGLRDLFADVATGSGAADDPALCFFLSFTGASLPWGEISPRVHIGLATADGPAEVFTYDLEDGLDPANYARRYNIQLAVRHGLSVLEQALTATSG